MTAAATAALAAGAVVLVQPSTAARRHHPGRSRRVQSARAGRLGMAWPSRRTDPLAEGQRLVELIEMVIVQVQAGAPPGTAWQVALAELPGERRAGSDLEPAAWLTRQSHTVPAAAAALAAWQLAERTGAPLAAALAGVARALRAEAEVQADVAVAAAGPRATARLLAVLPLGGLLLGELVGAGPLRVLLTTPPGRACAALGLGLALVGRAWMNRLVRAVGTAG